MSLIPQEVSENVHSWTDLASLGTTASPIREMPTPMAVSCRTGAFRRVSVLKYQKAVGASAGQAAEDRDGFKRQEAAIRQWAKPHGVRIVRWFRESISGTINPLDRPAFQEMLTALHCNGVKLVICEKYDRVARDLMWIEWAIRHLRDNGFSLVSASEPELADDTDPDRKAMRGMISIFAELEKSALVLKLRAARQRAKASRRDYREGRKPFGTRPGEQETIARIRELRAQGLAYDTIAEHLNAEAVPAMAGRWHATSVKSRPEGKLLTLLYPPRDGWSRGFSES